MVMPGTEHREVRMRPTGIEMEQNREDDRF
jgi:hypothetical protein